MFWGRSPQPRLSVNQIMYPVIIVSMRFSYFIASRSEPQVPFGSFGTQSVLPAVFAGAPEVEPFVVKPGEDGSIACIAGDASVTGSIQYEERFRNLGWWRDLASEASWPLQPAAAGAFDATIEYAASAECGGTGEWRLRVDGRTVASGTVELPGRTDWGDFATVPLGRIELPAGRCELAMKASRKNGDSFINLRRIDLRPAAAR